MTLLTCEKCQTQYTIPDEKLGEGRTVRCVSCGHAWFQTGVVAPVAMEEPPAAAPEAASEATPAEVEAAPPLSPAEAETAKSIQGSIDALLKAEEETEAAEKAAEAVAEEMLAPSAKPPGAVINYEPFGVGAAGFGFLVFVFLISVTLIFTVVARRTVAQHFPHTVALYQLAGLRPLPPGWSLRIEELAAEQRVDASAGGVLVISGKITNMRKHAASYPTLTVALRSRKRVMLKTLDIASTDAKIAPGESAPILLQLKDMPREAATVEVRVSDD